MFFVRSFDVFGYGECFLVFLAWRRWVHIVFVFVSVTNLADATELLTHHAATTLTGTDTDVLRLFPPQSPIDMPSKDSCYPFDSFFSPLPSLVFYRGHCCFPYPVFELFVLDCTPSPVWYCTRRSDAQIPPTRYVMFWFFYFLFNSLRCNVLLRPRFAFSNYTEL